MAATFLIVEDEYAVARGIQYALQQEGYEVALARSGEEGLEIATKSAPDVVLLDVRLEDGNGIQALAEREFRTRPAVLVISSFETSQYVAAAARYGAAGFLVKTVPLPTLVDRIRTVAAGGSGLTPEQLRTGLGNREIAAKLGGSPKTVETHLGSIFERYGIKGGRIELAIRAAEEGWLDIEPPPEPVGSAARSA